MVIYGFAEDDEDLESDDIHSACAMGDVTLVRAFINEVGAVDSRAKHLPEQQQQQPLEARDASGRTPLRVAIDHDRPEVARLLLLLPEKEEASRRRQRIAVDVNTRDARGWTPLASACAYARDERTLQLLLDAGADLNWKDPRDGSSLCDLAKRSGNETALALLERQAASPSSGNEGSSIVLGSTMEEEICCICERAPVNVTFFPCEHRTCDECSRRWRRCHVTLAGSICGIACRTEIRGRRMRIAAAVGREAEDDSTASEPDALKCQSFSYD